MLESTVIVAIYIYFVSVVKQYELMIREEDDDVKEEVKGDNGLSFEN